MHAVIIRPLYGSLQPVTHCLIGRGPQRFAAPGAFGGHPAPDLMNVAGVGERHQAHGVPRRPAAPAPHLLRQDAYEGAGPVQLEGLRRQHTGFADTRAGVPLRAKQKVVAPVRHVMQQRADLGRQQVAGVTPFAVAIRLSATAVAKSASGANDSAVTRSDEFCSPSVGSSSCNFHAVAAGRPA